MKVAFLSLTVSLMVHLSAARASSGDDERFRDIDALLAQVGAMVAQFDSQEKCSADFSLKAVAAEKRILPTDSMMGNVRRYQMCEAFSRRNPEVCRMLARDWPSPQDPDLEETCLDSYNRYTVTQLNITGRPDAAKVCETLPLSIGDLDGEGPQKECAFQTAKPDAGCKELIASVPPGAGESEDCVMQYILNGEGSVCPQINDDLVNHVSREWCMDSAAYRSAYHAGDSKLCGVFLGCRMLMGEKICGRHLEHVREEFCRLLTGEQRSRMDSLFIQLSELMEGFQSKSEPSYISRREIYKALRKKFGRLLKEREAVYPLVAKLDARGKCADDLSIDELVGGDTPFPGDEMMQDLRSYHECEAFSRRKPDFCNRLAQYWPSSQTRDFAADCLNSYNRYSVIELNITGRPDAAKVCETLTLFPGDLDGESAQVECAFQTAKPNASCKNALAPGKPAGTGEAEDCILQSILNGEGSVCSFSDGKQKFSGDEPLLINRTRCLDAAAYRDAYQARDSNRCGDSLGCRMLMGEKICERHLTRIRRELCRLRTHKSGR